MNPDHVHFADWDAAYLLGALSPADRRRFEEHLTECRACRDALADLAPTLGLLSRVAPDRAEAVLAPVDDAADAGPDPARRAELIDRGTREAHDQRRRRTLGWGLAFAGVAATVAIVLAVVWAVVPTRSGEVIALEPITDAPITATVEVTEVAWGTRLQMECRYGGEADGEGPADGWPYVLVVTGEDGTVSELSTWRARPGTTARLEAGTALAVADIAAIEVRTIDGERVLLRGEPVEVE